MPPARPRVPPLRPDAPGGSSLPTPVVAATAIPRASPLQAIHAPGSKSRPRRTDQPAAPAAAAFRFFFVSLLLLLGWSRWPNRRGSESQTWQVSFHESPAQQKRPRRAVGSQVVHRLRRDRQDLIVIPRASLPEQARRARSNRSSGRAPAQPFSEPVEDASHLDRPAARPPAVAAPADAVATVPARGRVVERAAAPSATRAGSGPRRRATIPWRRFPCRLSGAAHAFALDILPDPGRQTPQAGPRDAVLAPLPVVVRQPLGDPGPQRILRKFLRRERFHRHLRLPVARSTGSVFDTSGVDLPAAVSGQSRPFLTGRALLSASADRVRYRDPISADCARTGSSTAAA